MLIKKIVSFFKSNYLVGASFIYIVCSFILKGISFLTTPIFTRVMDTTDFGIVGAVSTWVTFVAIFICCQVSGSVASARVHKSLEDFNTFVGSITVFGIISAAILGTIMILLRNLIGPLMGIQPKLVIHVVIQAYEVALVSLYTSYLIQLKRPKCYLVFAVITTLAIVLLGLLFVLTAKDERYIWRIWATTIVDCVVALFIIVKFLPKAKLNKQRLISDWRFALSLGLPLIFHLISTTILGQSDRLFILHMIGESDAGIYTVAYSIGLIGMIFANACNDAWSPWYLENTKAKNDDTIKKMARLYIAFIALCFVEVYMIAPEIMEIMAPEPYWKAKPTVLFIIFAVFLQFLYRFPQAYETYCMNLKWTAIATMTAAILNCVLNYFLIQLWGINGAALATAISYMVLFFIHEIVARKIIGGYNIPIKTYIIPTLVCMGAGVLSFAFINVFWIRITILLVIAVVVAFVMIKLFRGGILGRFLKHST